MRFLHRPVRSFEDTALNFEQLEALLPARLQASQTTTGSIGAGARALITCPWGIPYTTATYGVVATVVDTEAGAVVGLRVERIESRTNNQVVVCVINDAAGARTGTVECLAIGS